MDRSSCRNVRPHTGKSRYGRVHHNDGCGVLGRFSSTSFSRVAVRRFVASAVVSGDLACVVFVQTALADGSFVSLPDPSNHLFVRRDRFPDHWMAILANGDHAVMVDVPTYLIVTDSVSSPFHIPPHPRRVGVRFMHGDPLNAQKPPVMAAFANRTLSGLFRINHCIHGIRCMDTACCRYLVNIDE